MSYEQCPKCELRFRHEAELTSHLATDHREVGEHLAEEFERLHDQRRRTLRRMRRAATGTQRPPEA